MTQKPTENIYIQLGQGESSKALPINQLVQRRNYDSIRDQFKIHLDHLNDLDLKNKAKNSMQGGYPYGSGWTQFIDGSRGAGKSTFLISIKQGLEADEEIKKQIAFIDVIDPSRIEKVEMPLLVILQKIRKIVKLAIGNYCQLKEEKSHNEWRDAFKGVAGGLSLFAKDYHPLNDLDSELFLDWGLERAGNSTGLRKALHQVFDSACHILGVKALVIGFDDADTDSTLTDSVLECIRKYLDTPQCHGVGGW